MAKFGRVESTIGLLVGLAIFGIVWSRRTRPAPLPEPTYAFDMCIAHAPTSPAHNTWNDAVLSAVARTLSEPERGSLEQALGDAATRWEAKANPMLEDLEGGDPDVEIIGWFKKGPSFLRTAQASAKLRTCTPDGFCVAPRAIGATCPEGYAPPASPDEADRARFIQWPWGHAFRFRAATPELARAAAATLREQARASKTFAIVMTAEDPAVTKVAPFATMRERWQKVATMKAAAHHQRKDPAAAAFTVEERPDEVIVLPRLEVIAAGAPDQTIVHEVTAAAPQLYAKH